MKVISTVIGAAARALDSGLMFLSRHLPPGALLLFGYSVYILTGTALLALPWCRTGDEASGNWLDWLFTATSAVSTTGLATVSTGGAYTALGQGVILLLIQLGGLGYMTLGSFVVLSTSQKIQPWREQVSRMALNLPENVQVATMLKLIVCYTLVVETVGIALLYVQFMNLGVKDALWSAIFHSVSAFCTAGFSLYDSSFESYRDHLGINLTLIALSYLGALGFIVMYDLLHLRKDRRGQITLTTKIILSSTAIITVLGTLGVYLGENGSNGANEISPLAAWFQAMTAFTTVGYNSVSIGGLSHASAFLIMILMLIGASPSGTGGGIKVTSITAAWSILTCVLQGNDRPSFMGKEIPETRRRLAVATIIFYLTMLISGIYIFTLVDSHDLFDQMFECASALGTVGLSRGITGNLNEAGKTILILLMLAGRIGPLALATGLFPRGEPRSETPPPEDVVI